MKTATWVHDWGYASYLYFGILVLYSALPPALTSHASDPDWLVLTGETVLLVILVVGGLPAVVGAFVSTIELWDHWPLPALAVLTAAVVYVDQSYGDSDAFGSLVAATRWLYVILALGTPLWWFFRERPRRLRSRGRPDDSRAA